MKACILTSFVLLLALTCVGCGSSSTGTVTDNADQQAIDDYNAMLEQQAKDREDWK